MKQPQFTWYPHTTSLPKAELNSHTHKKLTCSPFPGPYTTESYLKMRR